MKTHPFFTVISRLLCIPLLFLSACASIDQRHVVLVSVPEQNMVLLQDKIPIAQYPVSTSKFGLGNQPDSNRTPLGRFEIARKIGENAPPGTVFKDRLPTGEILPVDAPGRDPIVTRILWLHGLEEQNANSFSRYIYIHGTPEERNIGQPVSYGCIRMRSQDIIHLSSLVGHRARVFILNRPMETILQDVGALPAKGSSQ